MKKIEFLNAYFHPPGNDRILLGRLGAIRDGRIALEVHDAAALQTLSPVSLKPRGSQVTYPSYDQEQSKAFQGLFGLFADSLPDAFGLAVVRQKLGLKRPTFIRPKKRGSRSRSFRGLAMRVVSTWLFAASIGGKTEARCTFTRYGDCCSLPQVRTTPVMTL